ncbi:MAG: hypothetical protein HPY66_2335 [Firmicutes bacterium]|nr:hypothetical protein [Bacillota bacterium]
MKWKVFVLCIILVLAVFAAGKFSTTTIGGVATGYVPVFTVVGDVEKPLKVDTLEGFERIKEIVVVSGAASPDNGMGIISPTENIGYMTAGRLYAGIRLNFPVFEGKSSVENDGKTYGVSIYTQRRMVDLKTVIEEKHGNLLIMGRNGEYRRVKNDGYLEIGDNTIDYVCPDLKNRVADLAGIMVDPPVGSIMDAYYDTLHFLENDKNVMLIILDGFGYHQYLYAVEAGHANFLASLPPANMATSVYRPVTNAGLAAMYTGKPPEENGVNSRKQKDIKTPTVFNDALVMNKKCAMVEGDIKILNTSLEPRLNVDKNSNGITDDEILETALEYVNGDYNLLVVHFHGIDDSGHSYGDIHPSTMEAVSRTDGYVKELVSRWKGKVVITADHGMHSTPEAGDHGSFCFEDLIVPYIITDGEGRK